jgi:rhodanese-related sulfurtransferase
LIVILSEAKNLARASGYTDSSLRQNDKCPALCWKHLELGNVRLGTRDAGFGKVSEIAGGTAAREAAGLPIEKAKG